MTTVASRISIAVLGLAVLATVGAALAWACTPSAWITVSPSTGQPGTPVTVTGGDFAEVVEIRWNSPTGPILATAAGPSFTTQVTIPAAPADTHVIVAIGRNASGAVAGQGRASFTIGKASTAAPDSSGSGAAAPAPETGRGQPGSNSGSTSGGQRARSRPEDATVSGAERTRAVAGGGDRGAARADGAGGAANGVTRLDSGARVFSDSVRSPRTAGATRAASAKSPDDSKASLSQRSAADDLWSGFAPGTDRVLGSPAGEAAASASIPALSMTLLVLGLATVLTGIGVAGARRRRAPAPADEGRAASD